MLVITRPTKVPPGGYWRYTDKDTGAKLQHPYLNTLQEQVLKHRVANKLPFDLTDFIQTICNETGPNLCHEGSEKAMTTMEQAKSFLTSMRNFVESGMQMASKDILGLRLAKCQTCHHWGGTSGGTLLSGRCGLCGCRGVKLALASSTCPRGWW